MSAIRTFLWRGVGVPLFRATFHTWYGVRRAILRAFGADITSKTKFRRTVVIDRPWNVHASDLAMFGDYAVLRARESISVGARCVISQFAILSTELRDPAEPGCPVRSAPITIEDDCWIAADAMVLPGVTVHTGAVVGARSLVENDITPWSVAAGEPAVVRGERTLRSADEEAAA